MATVAGVTASVGSSGLSAIAINAVAKRYGIVLTPEEMAAVASLFVPFYHFGGQVLSIASLAVINKLNKWAGNPDLPADSVAPGLTTSPKA